MSAPRLLLTCVAEDTPHFHARVELLVGSARRHGGALADAPILVNLLDSADPAFAARMEAAGVETRVVPRLQPGVATVNKLRMLESDDRDDVDVLLAVDCDIAVAADPTPYVTCDAIGVVPADVDCFTEREWRGVDASLELPPSARSLRAACTGRPMRPYFNSGVIAVPRRLRAPLLDAWTAALRDLDALYDREPALIPRSKRFFADQVALAIALRRGLPWTGASRALNFPTHVPLHRPTLADVQPALLHYHGEIDAAGFLLQPRCAIAVAAAERVNRSRAEALGLPYETLRSRPRGHRTRLLADRWLASARQRVRRT